LPRTWRRASRLGGKIRVEFGLASVLVIRGPDKGQTYRLREGENVIGRQSEQIELSDGTISRVHARIVYANRRWLIEDLGSANGTWLNNARISKSTPLKRDDRVRVGNTVLSFQLTKARAAKNLPALDVDEHGRLVDVAIVATVPSSEDSIVIPTPEAGARAIGNLRLLYQLIAEAGTLLNIDGLLQHTLDRVVEFLKADRGYVMLVNEQGRLALKASHRPAKGRDQKAPISRTIINSVVTKQVGILSTNAMTDKRFASGKSVHDFGIRSAICVPIKGRDRILGIIHIDCNVSDQTYSTEQLRLMTAIGVQTGLALENVRLHHEAVAHERLAAVGETVAFLSHHIKNILQALSAGIDIVELGLAKQDVARARSAWPIVQRNLGRINELILNMLTFSKSRQPLLEFININAVLSECVELASPRADERSVALLSDLDNLPDIPADAAGLHQAFLNLLNNAMDAVSDGTGVITVTSRYDEPSQNVIARVVDNGSGIPAHQLERIFNPFFSGKGQRGTGLGLAVAKKIFQEHRGKIDVTSKVGAGTTFTITLPARAPAAGKDDTATPAAGDTRAADDTRAATAPHDSHADDAPIPVE
jgi:signal transduction histidine kinase/pSer/pThr/pTyr-binding forkhead associated (FHA) protein